MTTDLRYPNPDIIDRQLNMKILTTWSDELSARQLEEVVCALQVGEAVILPAGDAYAYACDSLKPKILNGITGEMPTTLLCGNISQASEYVRIDNEGFRILKEETPSEELFGFPAPASLARLYKCKELQIYIPTLALTRSIAERFDSALALSFIPGSGADDPEYLAEKHDSRAALMVLYQRPEY